MRHGRYPGAAWSHRSGVPPLSWARLSPTGLDNKENAPIIEAGTLLSECFPGVSIQTAYRIGYCLDTDSRLDCMAYSGACWIKPLLLVVEYDRKPRLFVGMKREDIGPGIVSCD